MRHNVKRKLFDDHLWLSIAYRKVQSPFTRAQRLSCCVALLYLTMIGNAMWYKAPDESSVGTQVLHLGPVTVSVAMLSASIFSSLVVIPPIMFITLFFTKSRQKPKEKRDSTLLKLFHAYYYKTTSHKPVISQPRKDPFSLPHWGIYCGWALVALSIAGAAFFTILYSFQWGGEKSTGWLIAFILSFFESIIIVQPAKVLLVAMVVSLILKKDVDTDEFEDYYGNMQNWYDIYNDNEIAKLRRNFGKPGVYDGNVKLKRLDNKVASMLKEIFCNFVVVFVMMCVAYISHDPNMYQQNFNLKSVLVENANEEVPNVFKVWPWIEEDLLPFLYYGEDYNGDAVSVYDNTFVSDTMAIRFGTPRLRQLRITGTCRIPIVIRHRARRCIPWFVKLSGDKTSYHSNWQIPLNQTEDITKLNRFQEAFRYQSAKDTKIRPYWANFETFPGDGFVANLGNTRKEANDIVRQLKSAKWVDERTRVLFVEFNVFNANTELFTQVILSFEFPPIGGVFTYHTFNTIQLYRYTGVTGLFSLIMEIISLFVFLALLGNCIKNIITDRENYLRDFWNWVHMIALGLYVAALVAYVIKMKWTVDNVEFMMNNREKTVSFQHVTFGDQVFVCLFGLLIFCLTLNFLHILRFNHTIAVLVQVLVESAKDLLAMAINIAIVVMAFAACGHVLFGPYMKGYQDMAIAWTTLSVNFLGAFDFSQVSHSAGRPGEVFILLYLLIMILIVINLFTTILCTFLDAVRADDSVVPKDHEVADHFLSILWGFLLPEKFLNKGEKEDSDHGNGPAADQYDEQLEH